MGMLGCSLHNARHQLAFCLCMSPTIDPSLSHSVDWLDCFSTCCFQERENIPLQHPQVHELACNWSRTCSVCSSAGAVDGGTSSTILNQEITRSSQRAAPITAASESTRRTRPGRLRAPSRPTASGLLQEPPGERAKDPSRRLSLSLKLQVSNWSSRTGAAKGKEKKRTTTRLVDLPVAGLIKRGWRDLIGWIQCDFLLQILGRPYFQRISRNKIMNMQNRACNVG